MAVIVVIDTLDGYYCKFISKHILYERPCKTKNEIFQFRKEMKKLINAWR